MRRTKTKNILTDVAIQSLLEHVTPSCRDQFLSMCNGLEILQVDLSEIESDFPRSYLIYGIMIRKNNFEIKLFEITEKNQDTDIKMVFQIIKKILLMPDSMEEFSDYFNGSNDGRMSDMPMFRSNPEGEKMIFRGYKERKSNLRKIFTRDDIDCLPSIGVL
jgi:hypothetical protein